MRNGNKEMKPKTIPIFYALVVAFLLCALARLHYSPPPPVRELDRLPPDLTPPKLDIPNSCFLSSVNLRGAYIAYCTAHKYHYWAKLLLMEQISKSDPTLKLAHVVCVFEYFGRFYVYDINHGVYMLTKKNIRNASAADVAATLKHQGNFTLGDSLWVEES